MLANTEKIKFLLRYRFNILEYRHHLNNVIASVWAG